MRAFRTVSCTIPARRPPPFARGIRNDSGFKGTGSTNSTSAGGGSGAESAQQTIDRTLKMVMGSGGGSRGGGSNMPNGAAIAAGGVVLGGLYVLRNAVLMTEAGINYVVTDKISGTLRVYTEPGLHYRTPFFSSVTMYKQIVSTTFEDSEDAGQKHQNNLFSDRIRQDAVTVRFADTYQGKIPVSFRFKMPIGETEMIKIHKEFRTEQNLVNQLLNRNARNVTVITATQYTGEEFFQGGLNQFKNQLSDQLNQGVYETRRAQVEVEATELAPVSKDQLDSRALQKQKQLVWKTVLVYDESNKPKRGENPLKQYDIEVTQVLLSDPRPEPALEKLLVDKKRLVADRIKAVQEQETSKAQAQTEQMKKDIQKTREVQDANRIKQLGIIAASREVEVAKQVAEKEVVEQEKLASLAKIQKEKELVVAKANYDIQKANSDASIYEAKAIAAKGKAEAEVLAAMYRAKAQNKAVFMAEMERDIAQTIYGNLKDFKIEMPHNYIGGGGGVDSGKLTSNLDVITGFSALGLMEKSGAKGGGILAK